MGCDMKVKSYSIKLFKIVLLLIGILNLSVRIFAGEHGKFQTLKYEVCCRNGAQRRVKTGTLKLVLEISSRTCDWIHPDLLYFGTKQ